MPTFHYRAYGAEGRFAAGDIEAASADAASEALWAQGLTPFELAALTGAAVPWWRRELFARPGLAPADLAFFTREFATLAGAEIPVDDALRIITEQASSPRLRALATELVAEILNGAPLSDALQRRPDIFASDYASVVRAGEIGGTLPQVFAELADLIERRLEVRTKIRSALVYPAVLVALSLVSIGVIIGVLIPSIAPIFVEGGRPMPDALRLLVALAAHWPELLIGIAATAAVVGAIAAIALRRPGLRLAADRLKLRIPKFGPFVLNQDCARFARTLGTLLKAGVPLLQAAAAARSVLVNRHLSAGMERAIDLIREGAPLNRALARETPMPTVALRLISIGEEAGRLDRLLLRVATMLEQQTERSIERFMTILTPALTIVVAGVVGALIMTVMNAVLSINEVVAR